MKLSRYTTVFVTIALLIILFLPANALCKKARIKDVIVTNTSKDLMIYFSVEGCFTKKMEDAILNGIPTTFTFFIDLYCPRGLWFDKTLATVTVRHTIVYNNLRNEFTVTLNSKDKKEVLLKDFLEAKKAMAEVNGITVIPMSSLKKNNKYYMRIKAKLDPIKLPFFLDYVLFFVSLWDFETDWYTESFIY
ncbi:MAG: DUF4390 domain-containing protein [Desulfobacterales bacterium]|nr:DUF4390 domain-containing protein [Desulfobacterales bacterium]